MILVYQILRQSISNGLTAFFYKIYDVVIILDKIGLLM